MSSERSPRERVLAHARRALFATSLAMAVASPLSVERARAEPPSCAAELDDDEVTERLEWIDARLRGGQAGAAVYWGGWLGYAAAEGAVGWAAFARTHDRLNRDTWLVTGVGSVLWIGEMLIFPMRAAYAPRRLARLPRGTPEERRIALRAAERLLDRAAATEREGLSWETHLLGLAWAVGSSAFILGRSLDRPGNASSDRHVLAVTGLEFGLTMLITEAAILTTPRRAIRDARAYRESRCGPLPPIARRAPPQLSVGASPTSVSLTLRF